MMPLVISKGTKYGRLTTIKETAKEITVSGRFFRRFDCKCECGNKINTRLQDLQSGRTKSCGCLQRENAAKAKTTHGLRNHPIRSVHKNMVQRCYNSNDKRYPRYGGRGIRICKEWRGENGVGNFAAWAFKNGYEQGLQIDRKNNDKGYYPKNCRFVTNKFNCLNQTKTIMCDIGEKQISFKLFWEKYNENVNFATARNRFLNMGMSPMDAVTLPLIRIRRKHKNNNRFWFNRKHRIILNSPDLA